MKLAPKKVYFTLTRRNPKQIADESRAGGVPPITTLPAHSFAFEENGSIKEIRYVLGESSIEPNEQSNRVKEQSVKDIIFTDGFIGVNETERALLSYLRSSVYNEKNNYPNSGYKTKFKEIDPEEQANKFMNEAKRGAEAEELFFKLMDNQHRMKGVLRKLGITGKGHPIRMKKGLDYVKKNPDSFIKLMANPQEISLAERIEYIHLAEETNILNYQLGKWSWEGAGEIIPVAKGENPHAYFAEWTFASKEGQGVWLRVKEVLDGGSKEEPKAVSTLPLSKTHEVMMSGLSDADLLQKGKDINVVVYERMQHKYTDLEGDVHEMGKSKTLASEFLSSNAEIRDELKRRIALSME